MSILRGPDGFNFYYGFRKEDSRRIDVRSEMRKPEWFAYVAGRMIPGAYETKDAAEAAAIAWVEANPET